MSVLSHIPRGEAVAALLAVGVSVALLAIKFVAYFLTGSAAVFSDAMESIVNVLASCFAFYSLYLAHQPPDENHPYGHGKVEFLSAGFEGGMILLAALVIAFKAVDNLVQGVQVESIDSGLVLMLAATAVNFAVGSYLLVTGKRSGSLTLEADGYHLLSDAVTSVVVVVALVIVRYTGFTYADPIAAILVSIYIIWIAQSLLRRSAAGLMDQQDMADEKLLVELLESHMGPGAREPRICSYHKLRHRHSGRYHWVDFHIVVPAHWDVRKGHKVATALEQEIEAALGEGDATAHIEPCIRGTCERCSPS